MKQVFDRLCLVEPVPADEPAVWRYRQVFIERDDTLAGTSGLDRADSYAAWLQAVRSDADAASVRSGYVPARLYLAKRAEDNVLVGMIQIRLSLNEYLQSVGGHIGYSVAPDERGKGYATEMLSLALGLCPGLGITRVLVTCDTVNVASAKVIRANGGQLENEVFDHGLAKQRYWIELEP